MSRQRVSYAWALHRELSRVPAGGLSDDAYSGLNYAQELAQEARRRSQRNIVRESLAPLTLADIAERQNLAVSTVRRQIKGAREELFGNLSDAAIYKRLQRQRQQRRGTPRLCGHPGCEHELGPETHASRRYCDQHRSVSERVRRHRQRTN
jgi:hypothetical protein